MRNIDFLAIVFLVIAIQSCRTKSTCEALVTKITTPNRIDTISDEKIYDGYTFPVESRFEYSCAFLNGKEITIALNKERKSDDNFSLKLLERDKYRLRNNDVIQVYFSDNRKLVWDWAGQMRIDFIIKKDVTPCDSVFNIVYQDVSGKIGDILTNDKVTTKELFDYTLKDKIKSYISTLSKADSIKFSNCQKNYFILDLINNKENFGFAENQYELTPKLKDYLNTIAEGIAFEIGQHDWEKSMFIIKCIGYADKQRYTGGRDINYKILGIDSLSSNISYTECEPLGKFADLNSTGDSKLTDIQNNCDLSILRSYVTIQYLKAKLKDLSNFTFIFQYKGGGEKDGDAFEKNRKIDLFVEIKAVAEDK
jgi:hypothetical protein